jgi:fructose-1,6-bisphosphatase-3
MMLKEFGLEGEHCHIINGHVPVKARKGESPIKGGGKLLVIDGGFSRAYQKTSGIAGYTLIYNSHGLSLAEHEPFESLEKAIKEGNDVVSHKTLVQRANKRKLVADTDVGSRLKEEISDLEALLKAYRDGIIKERL